MESLRLRKETRKYPRLSINLPFEYQAMHDSRLRTGLLGNLSNIGLLFYCRGEMSVGTTLLVRVMFADRYELTSFEACVKIIWKDLHFERDWREYKYGAEFTYISEDAKEKINRLLTTYSLEGNLSGDGLGSIRDNHTPLIS